VTSIFKGTRKELIKPFISEDNNSHFSESFSRLLLLLLLQKRERKRERLID
jgi:hypothetical protein